MEVDADSCKAPADSEAADERVARRKSAIGFGLAVSAACATAGGTLLAYLPGVSMGAAYGLGFGGLLFLQAFAFFLAPMLRPVEHMTMTMLLWMFKIANSLSMLFWGALIVALFDKVAAATTVMLVADVAGAASLSWLLSMKEGFSAQDSSPVDDMV
ncbi:hypothetical protein ACQJBY_034059 [Aegilops geniculata]